MNVLVIAPHPDDESIGCGGTICLHTARGDDVAIAFLTSGELGLKEVPRETAWATRESEAKQAAKILEARRIEFFREPDWSIAETIESAAAKLRDFAKIAPPQRIYLPHPGESHPDHAAALEVVRAAEIDAELYGYEVWTPLPQHDDVNDITTVMPRKLAAIRCYASQLREFRYDHAVRGLNRYRGELAAHCKYAEVFAIIEP
jgi:LmbE family N-acetylglucosaminyl deacetylase